MTRETILVVDDDVRTLSAFRRGAARDTEVLTAMDRDSAVHVCRQNRIDLGIIDALLGPGQPDGFDVIRALKLQQPQMRIVMISGMASIEMGMRASRVGAHDFVAKPITLGEILRRLTRGDRVARGPIDDAVRTPSLDRAVWEHLCRVLADCDGNKAETARRLRMHRSKLNRWLARGAPPE